MGQLVKNNHLSLIIVNLLFLNNLIVYFCSVCSASIEVVGTMGVKVPVLGEASVMANATAYHASHVEGNITLAGPHLKLNLNSTQGPMNLLNFSTNYFLVK